MNKNEARYRLLKALLAAETPLSAADLAGRCGLPEKQLRDALTSLLREGQVVEGDLIDGQAGPHYRWAAYWQAQSRHEAAKSRKDLARAVGAKERRPAHRLEIDGADIVAFHRFIIDQYSPPKDKRFLVFFQCSVRRPFSRSPSHGTMRRGISVSTGFDPWRDFEACPVHVVVLASRIGPVPYELEDTYPDNAGGGGVKHFRDEHYARVRPILAERMADYIAAHGGNYRHMAAFTSGRYGEVMRDAAAIAGVDYPIFPQPGDAEIITVGGRPPRTYWQRCWIQLCLEIMSWLTPKQRKAAQARLRQLKVEYAAPAGP